MSYRPPSPPSPSPRVVLFAVAVLTACSDKPLPTSPVGLPALRTHFALAVVDSQRQSHRPEEEFATRVALNVPGFGGLAFDPADRQLIVFVKDVAGQEAAARAAVAPMLARDFNGRIIKVKVRRADFDFLELGSFRDRVNAAVAAIPGVRFTDLDEFRNRVTIGLRRGSNAIPAVEDALAASGVPRNAITFEDVTVMSVECTEIDPPPECEPPPDQPAESVILQPVVEYPPPGGFAEPAAAPNTLSSRHRPKIEGGMKISFLKAAVHLGPLEVHSCTLGFSARLTGEVKFVTNSHCSRVESSVDNGSYYQPVPVGWDGMSTISDIPIGSEQMDAHYYLICTNPYPYCRYADANVLSSVGSIADLGKIAKPRFSSTTLHGGTAEIDPVNPKFTIIGTALPVENEIVNKVGWRTGWTVGNVTRLCADFIDATGYRTRCTHHATFGSDHGDSGSPVFRDSPNLNVTVLGVVFAGGPSGTSDFSGMYSIEAVAGGPLVLAP